MIVLSSDAYCNLFFNLTTNIETNVFQPFLVHGTQKDLKNFAAPFSGWKLLFVAHYVVKH
jgi:hypothetical protein